MSMSKTIEMNDEMSFGDRIRHLRQRLKFKQKSFALKLGISSAALSEIENDKYRPGFDFFYKIAKEFNVNLYYLFFGEGDIFLGSQAFSGIGFSTFVAKDKEMKNFLWYFENSPVVQYYILGQFRRFLNEEKEAIDRDIKRNKLE